MKVLVILRGPAYGDERAYNGLRLAGGLAKCDGIEVRVFCFGDAVGCAVAGQQLANGYYRLDRTITAAVYHGAEIGLCGTCMDPRDHRPDGHHRRPPIQPRRGHRLGAVGRQDDHLRTSAITDPRSPLRWVADADTYDTWFDQPRGAYAIAVEHRLLLDSAPPLSRLTV